VEKVQQQQQTQPKVSERESAYPAGTVPETSAEEPRIVEDICVEELAIDGICGVY
jgi:mycofactocin precursor